MYQLKRKVLLSSVLVSVVYSLSFSLWAISENNYQEEFLAATNYFESNVQNGVLIGQNLVPLHFSVVNPEAKDAIVILGGRTEFFAKYIELFYDLKDSGMSLYTLDHRGQGLSGRMLADSEKGHVDSFENYVLDLDLFLRSIVAEKKYDRVFFITHSLGGAILSSYLEKMKGKYPVNIVGAILSAPMLEINTGKYPLSVAYAMTKFKVLTGKGDEYVTPGSTFDAIFADNNVTSSDIRYKMTLDVFEKYPEAKLGGSTNRWVNEAIYNDYMIVKNAKKIDVPILLFQAGKDSVVMAEAQDKFCKLAKKCTKVLFPNAQHEILMEVDSIRDIALEKIKIMYKE